MSTEMKCYEGKHPRIIATDEFIERNRLRLQRSEADIMAKLQEPQYDCMGFRREVLLTCVSWDLKKSQYRQDYVDKVEKGEEKAPATITDVREVVQDMLDYLVFGWMKALDQRGISASRTVEKISAWCWLLGREDLAELVDRDDLYNPYGMPALIEVSKALGIEVPQDCIAFAEVKC